MAAELEPHRKGRFLLADDIHCTADILIPNWTGGRDDALDLTLPKLNLPQAAITPGIVLTHANEQKIRGAE